MDIVYSLDRLALEDFRSATVFNTVAKDAKLAATTQEQEKLTMLYPGSGSHMSPWLIPLQLMDQGIINSAEIIYTEIENKYLPVVERYLQWMQDEGIL